MIYKIAVLVEDIVMQIIFLMMLYLQWTGQKDFPWWAWILWGLVAGITRMNTEKKSCTE